MNQKCSYFDLAVVLALINKKKKASLSMKEIHLNYNLRLVTVMKFTSGGKRKK